MIDYFIEQNAFFAESKCKMGVDKVVVAML